MERAHRRWVDALVFENPVDQTVLAEYKLAIEQTERRLRALDKEIEEAAELPLYREHVAWLRCFRGIDTTVAMIFVAARARRVPRARAVIACEW